MRVVHLSDCYLPRTGGIELQVRGLTQAELAAGFEPQIVTATPATARQAVIPGETDDGVPVHRLAVRLPTQLPVTPHVGARLREVLDAARPDVVHVHGGLASPFAWPALRTAIKAGLPAVVTVHSVWGRWAGTVGASNAITKWRRWPVRWTAVSEVAAAPVRTALRGAADVRVLPNGIDVEAWRPPVRPAEDAAGAAASPERVHEMVVVSVARFAPRKRMRTLVERIVATQQRLPDRVRLRAILIGDGPERARVQRYLRRRDVDWIECVGWQTHAQIRAIYGDADVFVAPALLESFGIAALEARTFGLPVVAMAESGTAQFIRAGREGLLAHTDEEITQALFELATVPGLRAGMADHNRSTEPEFSWPKIVEQAGECYQEAIEMRRAAR